MLPRLLHTVATRLHALNGGLCRYDTGFKFAGDRFSGRLVALMAADMLLGDERRWQWLAANSTAAFFNSRAPRMILLSRLELDEYMEPCCADGNIAYPCLDAFVFRSPLHKDVRLDLFNFQQNVWQSEDYAVGLLRLGGYELYNPCFDLPLFHNHFSNQRPNQNENRYFDPNPYSSQTIATPTTCSLRLTELIPSPPSHCSMRDLRKHEWICSACWPERDPKVPCKEHRLGVLWHSSARFANNSKLAKSVS